MILGYTCGYFDVLHIDHIRLLRQAASLCDELFIGLATDERVAEAKGHPIFPYEERKEMLIALDIVPKDHIIPDSKGSLGALKSNLYDVYFKGENWENRLPDEEIKVCKDLNIKIIYIPVTKPKRSL